MLRLVFCTGTEPGKWFRRYRDSHAPDALQTVDADDAATVLLSGDADLALMRLPDARIDESFHTVRLYEEAPGIAVPKDSVYSEVGEEVAPADVADEIVNYRIGRTRLSTSPRSAPPSKSWPPTWAWLSLHAHCSRC